MRVLGLEPYYGGSHQAFLDGWMRHSAHAWELMTLSGPNWRWRMRHAPVTFSQRVRARLAEGATWDVLFCSDMLDLATFVGLVPEIAELPSVVFFHENQLSYPIEDATARDYHCAFTNFTTCLAADSVWFNSAFHQGEFLDSLRGFLRRMPNYRHLDQPDAILSKSQVQALGIAPLPRSGDGRRQGPMRIVWAARWEYDKRPDLFFEALDLLMEQRVAFEVYVLGGRDSENAGKLFADARGRLGERVGAWGYVDSAEEYVRILTEADVVVSTADHEFFGLSIVEAVAAGAYPVVPNRLAYPEVLRELRHLPHAFHDGTATAITSALSAIAADLETGTLWGHDRQTGLKAVEPYLWDRRAPALDTALNDVM